LSQVTQHRKKKRGRVKTYTVNLRTKGSKHTRETDDHRFEKAETGKPRQRVKGSNKHTTPAPSQKHVGEKHHAKPKKQGAKRKKTHQKKNETTGRGEDLHRHTKVSQLMADSKRDYRNVYTWKKVHG